MDHVASLLLGLGNGGVFAALALALVITYRASGVVNFATGAMALYVAYTYAGLRRGELLVPIPGLPKTVDLGQELELLARRRALDGRSRPLLGALLYVLVFRPLRDAPPAGQGGGVARRPRGDPGPAGDPAGHQHRERRRDLPGRALGARDRSSCCPTGSTSRSRSSCWRSRCRPRFRYTRFGLLDAGDGGDPDRGLRQRRLARPDRAGQLDDQRHGRRHRRHPHRPGEPADAGDLHALRRPGPGRRGRGPVPAPRADRGRRPRHRHAAVRGAVAGGRLLVDAPDRGGRAGAADRHPGRAGRRRAAASPHAAASSGQPLGRAPAAAIAPGPRGRRRRRRAARPAC